MKHLAIAAAMSCILATPGLSDGKDKPLVVSTQSLPVVAGAAGSAAAVPVIAAVVTALLFSISGSSGSHGANLGP